MKQKGFAQIFIIILLLILIVVITYVGLKQIKIKSNPKVSSTPTATADPTANWKTYTTDLFSLKYPSDWNAPVKSIDSSGDTSHTFESGNFVITEGLGGIFNLEQKQSYSQLISYEEKVTTGTKDITVSGIKTVEYFDTDGPSTSAPTIVLTDTEKNVYLISMAIPAESNSNLFDQIVSTFQFTNQVGDPNQQVITNLVNNFYSALENQDGKTLFGLMTAPKTQAEKSDFSWLIGENTGTTPTYRVFIRSKINNQKITSIEKQNDGSYLVSITDQFYQYSNAGQFVGFYNPQSRNVAILAVNTSGQWLVDKFTDLSNTSGSGNAGTTKYNGFGQ